MIIAPALLEQVVQHARLEAPNECCGLIAVTQGRAVSVHELENLAASPLRFEVDGAKLAPLLFEIEEAGQQAAIYHSHTRSDPYPSQTDVNFARWWPGCEWLIIGLENAADPIARSFMIGDEGVIEEIGVEIDG
ncbi:MAG: M67 family metallopeptidase [Solirubrobacteraceae bacterium]|jgi:[CysO sulfur-carrier protein]-S-L-cysteine hydrolase|nr:M67 family metallopeptidase [Solirubrobacteraceae bacterium]MDP4672360.1 M67 family metallopeptidase [Solirubrobacteraceae bacterium]MDP4921056.1 M67 family metallopeptidase [Solirubrobacteraceae bacterium]MDP5034434.1 M67 family metallopeptidase [Solirubrobacteraceae bacterium]